MDQENSSIFKAYKTYECWRGEKQFILKTSIGRQLPYIVNIKQNVCQIFDIEWEKVTHSFIFPEGCKVIDVDYFPTKEGQLGILVGVEDPRHSWGAENFVVALAANPDMPNMRVTHSAEVPTRITVVKTLFSSADMFQNVTKYVLKLFHKLMTWEHVVAIGCEECHCHLARLSPTRTSSNIPITIHSDTRNLIDLMGAFVNESMLQYHFHEGFYKDFPAAGVSISALALMPRSRTLLVGLSMGGIMAASLNPSNHMTLLELRHDRLIKNITPLEPEDDPDKFEFFIVAVDSSPRHPIMMQVWRGSFKTTENVTEEEKYDQPYFVLNLEHKFLFGEKWISLNTIVNEREHLMTTRKRLAEESQMNISQSFGATSNRATVLLTFGKKKLATYGDDPNVEPPNVVEAAVFDIDAWYYKRTTGRVSSDGTVLKQCAFLSTIKTDIPSEGVNDVGILTLNATDVYRFSSMISDADQLYYPSALTFERVFLAKNTGIEWNKIQNIQETIINRCAAKLPFYILSAESVCNIIIAAGLVRKNILSGSPNSSAAEVKHSQLTSEQKVLLSLIVYYGRIEEFRQLAIRPEISETLKKEIAEWAIHEAVNYKRTISDKTVFIFQGKTTDLSPLAEESFIQGIKLFRVIYDYLKTCSRTLKSSLFHNYAHSVKCLQNHTKLTHQFILFDIIPVDKDRQEKMREMHVKRKIEAMRQSATLPIQAVIRNMERLAPKAQFWNNVPHNEWYPPTPLDLLESLLNVSISERIKRELVVQYVIDWIRSAPEIPNYTQRQMAIEVIKVMTNQMLDVDLEKIFYVMDEEKKALMDNKASEQMRALGEKVFSMQNEELAYDKLWGESFPMGYTISEYDMERFAMRMKMQLKGGLHKLPVLDTETEMMYQVYLFEKKQFDAMSPEAIQSNDMFKMLMPGVTKKKNDIQPQKTAREREIETSVRNMFAIDSKRQKEEMGSMFASVAKPERKKRSNQFGDDDSSSSSSSAIFVPPTAKKIQLWKKSNDTAITPSSPAHHDSSITSQISSDEPYQNAEINLLIATPARYYKRPDDVDLETNLLSPSSHKAPPAPAQNSILKTAKAVQSSRGRIRFHESVPRGTDESVEEPKGLKLNFAILEDDEEELTMTTRKSKASECQDDVMEKDEEEEINKEGIQGEDEDYDECMETEKSFEKQDDFEVLEVVSSSESSIESADATEAQDNEITEKETDEVSTVGDEYKEEIESNDAFVIRSSEIQSDDDCEVVRDIETRADLEKRRMETERTTEKKELTETDKTEEIQEDIEEPDKHEEGKEASKKVRNPEEHLVHQSNEMTGTHDGVEKSFEAQDDNDLGTQEISAMCETSPSRNTRSSTIPETPVTKTRTRSSSVIKINDGEVEKKELSTSTRSTRRSSSRSESRGTSPTRVSKPSSSSNTSRRSVSRAASQETVTATREFCTSSRGGTRREAQSASSKETRKRDSSDCDDTDTPTKRLRGRPRLTPLKAIPESQSEPSTSDTCVSNAPSTSTITPKRGRGRPSKASLANVVEEKEDKDQSAVLETPLRRSTRHSSSN